MKTAASRVPWRAAGPVAGRRVGAQGPGCSGPESCTLRGVPGHGVRDPSPAPGRSPPPGTVKGPMQPPPTLPCSAAHGPAPQRHQPRPAQAPAVRHAIPGRAAQLVLSTTPLCLAGRDLRGERRDRGSRRLHGADACGQAAQQVDETLTVPQMTFSDVLSMAGQAAGLSVSSIPCPPGESALVTAGRRVCGYRRRGSGAALRPGLGGGLSATLCPQKRPEVRG